MSEEAQQIFIAMERVNAGPPAPWRMWNQPGCMLAYIRGLGIDAEDVINYTRAPDRLGFIIYYRGAAPTARQKMRAVIGSA